MKRMKRVLLLACLIVSLVELDWERYRIFLLSSIAFFLFVLGSELTQRRRVQQVTAEPAFKTDEGVPSEAYIAGSPNTAMEQGRVATGTNARLRAGSTANLAAGYMEIL
jgi:hypothetical protein